MSNPESKVDNPKLLFLVFVLMLVAVGVVILSLNKSKGDVVTSIDSNVTPEIKIDEEGKPLTDYFNYDQSSESNSSSKNEYMQTDPFKEKCLGDINSGKPYVVSGTVCYY